MTLYAQLVFEATNRKGEGGSLLPVYVRQYIDRGVDLQLTNV